jgi:hypothetical protein
MTDHPITPPPELVKQWLNDFYGPATMPGLAPGEMALHLADVAVRWGADQELEACIGYVDTHVSGNRARALRTARRPKPPSLKEQALEELNRLIALIPSEGALAMANPIRCALEALDD